MTDAGVISNYQAPETVHSFQKRLINLVTFGAHFFGINNYLEHNIEHLEANSKTLCEPQIGVPESTHQINERGPRTGRLASPSVQFTPTSAWSWPCTPCPLCFHVLDTHSNPIKVCRAGLSLWQGLWPGH